MILPAALPAPRALRFWPGFPVAVSVLLFALLLGWAFFPALFASADPLLADPTQTLRPPSAAHLFGTDHLGRDLYARCVHGAALSLQATGIAVLIALVAGTLLGGIAGWFGGVADRVLAVLVEVLMAIPGLLLAMAIVTALGFGTLEIAVAVGLSSVAVFARLARGEVLRWRSRTFVEAAQVLGVGPWVNLWRHVLPHAAGPLLALAALEFAAAVLAVSALSFLGFGAPPPQPEWGLLIAEGRNYMVVAWWYTTLPGLVVAAVVLATQQLGRGLQRLQGETA